MAHEVLIKSNNTQMRSAVLNNVAFMRFRNLNGEVAPIIKEIEEIENPQRIQEIIKNHGSS